MYIIPKKNVNRIAEALIADHSLYGPLYGEGSGQVTFTKLTDAQQLNLSAPIPFIPPKGIFTPQYEEIMKFNYDSKSKKLDVRDLVEAKPRALLGMRPCDLEALLCMDRFLLGQEFVDQIYLNHRKKTFIVANTCVAPFEQCFCVCTDSGPAAKEGFDLNLTDLGDDYLVETGSDKGKALAVKMGLSKGEERHLKEKKLAVDRSISLFKDVAKENKAWISRVMNRITTGFIDPAVWEYIGNQCFDCGACSFVCPTCTCFNVEDAGAGNGETGRFRTWDSCSFEGYTKMAGDHNPRKPVEDRRNKRFFCKLSYSQSKKYLRPGCVGCGRCARVCPGNIGLPNVVTYIRREITE